MRLMLASLALLACGVATAQGYPNRPVKIVVPFAAGSGSDVYTRLIADDFRMAFNQTFVVDNKGGASAQIGTLQVALSTGKLLSNMQRWAPNDSMQACMYGAQAAASCSDDGGSACL